MNLVGTLIKPIQVRAATRTPRHASPPIPCTPPGLVMALINFEINMIRALMNLELKTVRALIELESPPPPCTTRGSQESVDCCTNQGNVRRRFDPTLRVGGTQDEPKKITTQIW